MLPRCAWLCAAAVRLDSVHVCSDCVLLPLCALNVCSDCVPWLCALTVCCCHYLAVCCCRCVLVQCHLVGAAATILLCAAVTVCLYNVTWWVLLPLFGCVLLLFEIPQRVRAVALALCARCLLLLCFMGM